MRLLADLNEELLPAVIDVLEPFDRATKHLSADRMPTLHLVVATKYQLQKSLSFVANDNEIIIQLKQHLTCKLNDSFHIVLLHYCACILDPRQKNNLNLMAPADRDSTLHSLKQMVTAEITLANNNNTTVSAQQEVQPPSAKVPKVADAGFFDDLFIQRQPSLSLAGDRDEVNEYLNENENETELAASDLKFDLKQYWKRKSTKWPRLCLVARNIFSVPASSTSSEKVFSLAGRTLEDRRCQLLPETVDGLLFLHSLE